MKKIRFVLAMSYLSLLVSCGSFFTDNKLDEKIQETIKYANASRSNILIDDDKTMGAFLPNGEKECRVDYPIEIQYTVNFENYVFKGVKAVSSKDNSVSREEYVKIETAPIPEKENSYKITITLLKTCDDIFIRPVCQLIPRATGFYPPFDNAGYAQDTPIKVYFNKAVKLEDFADENGYLKNIQIKHKETDLLETENGSIPHFSNPYLENEGKTLVIPVTKGNYFIDQANITKDLTVTVNLNGLKDGVEGDNLAFTQENYSFLTRFNGTKDAEPPVIKKLNIARTQQDALNGTNLITKEKFQDYAAKANYGGDSDKVFDNIQNHHVNGIWVSFETADYESGIKSFVVQETFIRQTNGTDVIPDTPLETIFTNTSEEKALSGSFEYKFKSVNDGVVRLTFVATDYSGITKTECLDLIKDTVCTVTFSTKHTRTENPEDNTESGDIVLTINEGTVFATDMDGIAYKDSPPPNIIDSTKENEEITFHPTLLDNQYCKIEKLEYGIDEEHLSSYEVTQDDLCFIPYKQYGDSGYKFHQYSMHYSYSRSKLQDYVIYLILKDYVGNTTRSQIVSRKKAINIIDCDIQELSMNFTIGNVAADEGSIYYTRTSPTATKTAVCYRDDSNSQHYLKIKAGECFTDYFENFATPSSGTTKTLNQMPNGTYYFFFYSSERGHSSVPFVLTKDSTGFKKQTLTVPQDSDIPSFSVSADPAVKNVGTRRIHITYNEDPSFFKDDFTYLIEYTNDGKNYYSPDLDFDIPVNYKDYSFRSVVLAANGERKTGATVSYSGPALDYDNKAPNMEFPMSPVVSSLLCSNFIYSNPIIQDYDGVGLVKDSDTEKVIVKYVEAQENFDISALDWNNSPLVKTVLAEPDTEANIYLIKIPIDNYRKGEYHFYIQDNNGNDFVVYKHFYAELSRSNVTAKQNFINELPEVSYSEEQSKIKVCYEANVTGFHPNYEFIYTYLYLNNGEWNYTAQTPLFRSIPFSNYSNTFDNSSHNTTKESLGNARNAHTSYVQLASGEDNSFIKICYISYCTYTLAPVYIYPPYYTNPNFKCKLKSYYECANNRLAILSDQMCLVHTLYGSVNFSKDIDKSTNMQKAAQEWINSAQEAGVQQESESFTYSIPVDKVPAGSYYTTIIHYADGTMEMTDVEYKAR